MKIIDKRKFFRSTGITISLLVLLILLLMKTTSLSHTETNLKKIEVVAGDTLWSIASNLQNTNYYNGKDVRDIIQNIKDINNLKNSNLSVGDELLIPTI